MTTRHAVQYQSSSKGAVDIESMATPHIAHAAKKITDNSSDPPGENGMQVLQCMVDELASRATSVAAKAVLVKAVEWHRGHPENLPAAASDQESDLRLAIEKYMPTPAPPEDDVPPLEEDPRA